MIRYYTREQEVGEAVRQSGLKQSDVFIPTKILYIYIHTLSTLIGYQQWLTQDRSKLVCISSCISRVLPWIYAQVDIYAAVQNA